MKTVRHAALDLLARREHSCDELKKKLSRRFQDVDACIEKLIEEDLLSDQRFSEMFVRSRISRGNGPNKILAELRQRGVSDQDIHSAIESQAPDWIDVIQKLAMQKYGDSPPQDDKERAKRMRFFMYKGFSLDHIRRVMSL